MKRINHETLAQNYSILTLFFSPLFGHPASNVEINILIVNSTIQYLLSNKRYQEALSSEESRESFLTIFSFIAIVIFIDCSYNTIIFIIAISYLKGNFSCTCF